MTEDLENKVICLHQIFGDKMLTNTKPEGWGYCYKCIYDTTENPKCAGYTPIHYSTWYVTILDSLLE